MPNLTRGDLRAFLPQYSLPDGQLDLVILIVRSWLLEDTELDALPDPLPETLWGPALELAAILASNPESLAQKTVGPTSRSWPMQRQADAIRDRLRRRWARTRLAPTGSYPDPTPYPEPAQVDYTVLPSGAVWTNGWTVYPL